MAIQVHSSELLAGGVSLVLAVNHNISIGFIRKALADVGYAQVYFTEMPGSQRVRVDIAGATKDEVIQKLAASSDFSL